jgi:hypothetical protein
MPDNFGFYQPILLNVTVPDGPREFKVGWYYGCKTALANRTFANSFVYQGAKGPDHGSGIDQHDSAYQTGFGQGAAICFNYIGTFTHDKFRSFAQSPLQ